MFPGCPDRHSVLGPSVLVLSQRLRGRWVMADRPTSPSPSDGTTTTAPTPQLSSVCSAGETECVSGVSRSHWSFGEPLGEVVALSERGLPPNPWRRWSEWVLSGDPPASLQRSPCHETGLNPSVLFSGAGPFDVQPQEVMRLREDYIRRVERSGRQLEDECRNLEYLMERGWQDAPVSLFGHLLQQPRSLDTTDSLQPIDRAGGRRCGVGGRTETFLVKMITGLSTVGDGIEAIERHCRDAFDLTSSQVRTVRVVEQRGSNAKTLRTARGIPDRELRVVLQFVNLPPHRTEAVGNSFVDHVRKGLLPGVHAQEAQRLSSHTGTADYQSMLAEQREDMTRLEEGLIASSAIDAEEIGTSPYVMPLSPFEVPRTAEELAMGMSLSSTMAERQRAARRDKLREEANTLKRESEVQRKRRMEERHELHRLAMDDWRSRYAEARAVQREGAGRSEDPS